MLNNMIIINKNNMILITGIILIILSIIIIPILPAYAGTDQYSITPYTYSYGSYLPLSLT